MKKNYDAMLKATEDNYTVSRSLKNGLNEQNLFLNTIRARGGYVQQFSSDARGGARGGAEFTGQ